MSDDDLLLRGFTICQVMDCIAELWDRLDAVFPYLNAAAPSLMYYPGANTVTVERGGRILTFGLRSVE